MVRLTLQQKFCKTQKQLLSCDQNPVIANYSASMNAARGNPERRWSPTVRRRRLARTLAALRASDGRAAAEIARVLGVAESTVTRLEDPRHLTLPKPDLIARLLEVYGASDNDHADVSVLVEQARTRDWWHPYKPLLSPWDIQYLGFEAEASILRVWDPVMLPPLLQTVEYARAVREASPRHRDPATLDELDAMHAQRVEFLLSSPEPVHLRVLVGETALRRVVGGPAIMRAQLLHLLELTETVDLLLQVVRNEAGALPEPRAFTIITFMEVLDPEAIRTVSAAGASHWVEDRGDIVAIETAWETLVGMGSPVPATRTFIADLANQLR